MQSLSVREARLHFSNLLNEAERGSSVSITKRGREVARLVPATPELSTVFPELKEFRQSIDVQGKPTSQWVIELREEERF